MLLIGQKGQQKGHQDKARGFLNLSYLIAFLEERKLWKILTVFEKNNELSILLYMLTFLHGSFAKSSNWDLLNKLGFLHLERNLGQMYD